MRTPMVTKKFRLLYNKGVVHDDGTITSFYNSFSVTSTLLRPAVPCLNFVTEITGGQSALLVGRACPEVAFLRDLKGNCVSFW